MQKSPVIVIGIGEMGSVFARGFLRLGHPVYPVLRETDMHALAADIPAPELVLVAVGETALQGILEQMPTAWLNRIALLQNELLPNDYAELANPTVISVWFEKKKGNDAKVLIPSPAFGPQAQRLIDALASLDIAARRVDSPDAMLFELVVKNVYIVTTNIAGLKVGGTVGELRQNHPELMRDVAKDVISIQQALSGREFDVETLIEAMLVAFEGDLEHKCMGRSAPARLQRALEHAEQYHLPIPMLKAIAKEQA